MYRFVIVFALVLTSCFDASDAAMMRGEFGATQGGVQDMTLARELVRNGMVPPAEAFQVEGMFSEHDLPLEGTACSTVLCLRAAMGVAPNAQNEPAAWVQIGMSSTIDPATFERPALDLIATVDVSGSMGWGYGAGGTPGGLSRSLLHQIAAELDAGDRMAVVTYGSSVTTALPLTAGNDAAIQQTINNLHEAGSTNMEAGLTRAYAIAESALQSGRQVRVMLFTDMQPNVGATSPTSFEGMAQSGADKGIGLTVYGLGLGLGSNLMTAMSHMHGANAFSIMAPEAIEPFMEDNWPWMVSPIAYDLSISVTAADGYSLTQSYGFPQGTDPQSTSLDVATVFLSKRKGGLLIELQPLAASGLNGAQVDLRLSYVEVAGAARQETLSVSYDGQALDARGHFMPQIGIAKTVALALLVAGMKDAAEEYGASSYNAIRILGPCLQRLAADATEIQDPAIDAEAEFWPALLTLMQAGAKQGNMYGGF